MCMAILPHRVVRNDRIGVCAIDDRFKLRTQGSCLGLICGILGKAKMGGICHILGGGI